MHIKNIAALLLAVTLLILSGCTETNSDAPDIFSETAESDTASGGAGSDTGNTDSTEDSTDSTDTPTVPSPEDSGSDASTSEESTEEPEESTEEPEESTEEPEESAEESAESAEEPEESAEGSDTSTAPAECSHSYGNWSVLKHVTCTEDGLKNRTCGKCGNAQQETIAATGHTWDSGEVTSAPTGCSDIGTLTYTCTKCTTAKTEQINGKHTFGEWAYEEYTYIEPAPFNDPWHQDTVVSSHRQARICTLCGYKETGNTPDHSCTKGGANHTKTTVKAGTCTIPATMRSTCKICGWYVDYEGRTAPHTWTDETIHLTDYGAYTNELDATISECTACGTRSVIYQRGEGWSDYNRYRHAISFTGNYYGNQPVNDNFNYIDHPTWQFVKRDFQYDSEGYVKQFTVYWWYNGQRYSQIIDCTTAGLSAWFAEYGLSIDGNVKCHFKIYGTYLAPYKTSYTV